MCCSDQLNPPRKADIRPCAELGYSSNRSEVRDLEKNRRLPITTGRELFFTARIGFCMTALWWQAGVIYQIYPRSFQDTNDDGIGDLTGIGRRLQYLVSLGVDAIWISPFFPSPMVDFGYDVSDYCDVDPRFGTLGEFDALVDEAHALGLRIIIDWVPNHTSDQHPWFLDAVTGRDSQHRNWYVWRDPSSDGPPPNNWVASFDRSAPAWTLDEASCQWYLHLFEA